MMTPLERDAYQRALGAHNAAHELHSRLCDLNAPQDALTVSADYIRQTLDALNEASQPLFYASRYAVVAEVFHVNTAHA